MFPFRDDGRAAVRFASLEVRFPHASEDRVYRAFAFVDLNVSGDPSGASRQLPRPDRCPALRHRHADGVPGRRSGGVPVGPCRRAARPRRDRPHRPRGGRGGARGERTARPGIRAAEVTVIPPGRATDAEPLSVPAVSATGTDPPGGRRRTPALAAPDHGATGGGGGRCRVRRDGPGPVRRAPGDGGLVQDAGSGTRIRAGGFDAADDLKKRPAFDAVTAARVSDLTALARERPETPATEDFPEGDIDLLHTMLESQGHRDVVRPPDGRAPDIRTSVIDLGRPVGSHPNPRRPLPGTKKVRRGPGRPNRAIQVRDALGMRRREWDDVQVWDFVRSPARCASGPAKAWMFIICSRHRPSHRNPGRRSDWPGHGLVKPESAGFGTVTEKTRGFLADTNYCIRRFQ